jgi:hypothetical protein
MANDSAKRIVKENEASLKKLLLSILGVNVSEKAKEIKQN